MEDVMTWGSSEMNQPMDKTSLVSGIERQSRMPDALRSSRLKARISFSSSSVNRKAAKRSSFLLI